LKTIVSSHTIIAAKSNNNDAKINKEANMARILLIAPYPGLKELFIEITQETGKKVEIEIGELTKGLAIAREREKEGWDAIISHGTTARLLQQHCHIPVVEVRSSGYDMLRTLMLLKGFPGKIGVVGSHGFIQGAETVGTLLDMDLSFFLTEKEEDNETVLQQAAVQGVQTIISEVISQVDAANYGLHTFSVVPGREAVIEAINEAERISTYTAREKATHFLYENIFRGYEDGIVAIDAKRNKMIANKKAEVLLGIEAELNSENTGEATTLCFQFDDIVIQGQLSTEEICNISGKEILVKKRVIIDKDEVVGAFAILKEIDELKRTESRLRRIVYGPKRAQTRFTDLIATTEEMKSQIETARLFSKYETPVLIYGEPGVGKQSLAEAIHNDSPRRDRPFLILDCGTLCDSDLQTDLFGEDGAELFNTARGGTIYLSSIEKLSPDVQDKLIHLLQEAKKKQAGNPELSPFFPRIIASNSRELQFEIKRGRFRKELYRMLSGGTLRIPSLRERKADIPELVRWFIASFNMREGKQIVGVRPEVMAQLTEAPWPENVRQLKSTVEKLCQTGRGMFIEAAEAEDILRELFTVPEPSLEAEEETSGQTSAKPEISRKPSSNREHTESNAFSIQIENKTLEELEAEIIMRVLEEEHNNQSQAAKRLGINRTTLWRKINKA
jgi:transcriptional regulator with PAS, ATPase and Fis domain